MERSRCVMRNILICTIHQLFLGGSNKKNIRWERSGAYRVMAGIPKGGKPLRRPRRRWEDNMKRNLQAVVLD